MAAVGEGRITYDARGLAEPAAEAPRVAEIDGDRATFDAHELSSRLNRGSMPATPGRSSRAANAAPVRSLAGHICAIYIFPARFWRRAR